MEDKYIIYRPDGQQKANVNPGRGSSFRYDFLKEHNLKLCFSSDTNIKVCMGDYTVDNGLVYTVMDDYEPVFVEERYKYEVEFHAPEIFFQNLPFFFVHHGKVFAQEKWRFKAKPSVFIDAIIACIAYYTGAKWTKGTISPEETLSMTFTEISVFDAISAVADACGTEWSVSGTTINLTTNYGKSKVTTLDRTIEVSGALDGAKPCFDHLLD